MRLGQTSAIHFLSRFGSSIIGFLAMVYFARELGSGLLGVYFLALALAAWLKIGCNMGITTAVAKRVSEQRAKNDHVIAGFLFVTTGFLVVAAGIFVFRGYVNAYLGADLYYFVVLLLGAQVLYMFVGAVLKGEHLVHVQGLLGISQTVSRATLQVLAVYTGLGVAGLLVGEIAGFIIVTVGGAVLLLTVFDRDLTLRIPERESFSSLFHYAKYSWLGTLKGRSYNLMDTIVLGFFVPSGLIGIYSICWNISSMMDMFAKSLGTSFFPEMSELSSSDEEGRVAEHLTETLAFSGLFIIPGLAGAAVIGDGILSIYGSEFTDGYGILLLLVLAALFHSYHTQFVTTLDAIDRPELTFRINAFFIATNMSLNVVLVYTYGWVGAAIATVVSVASSLLLGYKLTSQILNFDLPYRAVINQTFAATLMAGFVYVFTTFVAVMGYSPNRIVPVLIAVIVGVVTYFSCLVVISTRFRTAVFENLPVAHPLQ